MSEKVRISVGRNSFDAECIIKGVNVFSIFPVTSANLELRADEMPKLTLNLHAMDTEIEIGQCKVDTVLQFRGKKYKIVELME